MFAQRDTGRNSPASPVAVAGIGSGTAAPDDRTLIPATTAAATALMLRKSRRRCRRGRWRYLRALLCAPVLCSRRHQGEVSGAAMFYCSIVILFQYSNLSYRFLGLVDFAI